jgi:hypothetical protein
MKTVTTIKYRRGRQGPSARSLRRAIGRSRVRIGPRVALVLLAFFLLVGAIGVCINMEIEKLEREYHAHKG